MGTTARCAPLFSRYLLLALCSISDTRARASIPQLMCPRDNARLFCSGHGTCAFDAAIDPLPYCVCDHYTTQAQCAAAGLFFHGEGGCSYHDADLGFAPCYRSGLCGICQDAASGVGPPLLLALAAAMVLLLG